MLKKTLTYTDYNGNERTEDCYFNLTLTELVDLGFADGDSATNKIQEIMDKSDSKAMINLYKKIILAAYGVKSEDGREFIKNKELTEKFERSELYNLLFMELCFNEGASAEFINGVLPSNIKSMMEKNQINAISMK